MHGRESVRRAVRIAVRVIGQRRTAVRPTVNRFIRQPERAKIAQIFWLKTWIDVFPGNEKDMIRSMLSESVEAIISQTLLPKPEGGRVAAWEIMIGTPAIRNLIRENKVPQMYSVMQTSHDLGMQTMDQCLLDLVRRRQISMDTVRERALDKQKIDSMMKVNS